MVSVNGKPVTPTTLLDDIKAADDGSSERRIVFRTNPELERFKAFQKLVAATEQLSMYKVLEEKGGGAVLDHEKNEKVCCEYWPYGGGFRFKWKVMLGESAWTVSDALHGSDDRWRGDSAEGSRRRREGVAPTPRRGRADAAPTRIPGRAPRGKHLGESLSGAAEYRTRVLDLSATSVETRPSKSPLRYQANKKVDDYHVFMAVVLEEQRVAGVVGQLKAKYDLDQRVPAAEAMDRAALPAAVVVSDGDDVVGKIKELAALRDAGTLTEDEFSSAKAKLLG